ncbi:MULTISPECIES: hypothetical protein [Bacteria]|uniref:hypothetical protein n=1 Tax=Bacteria TaxID=2 RepID=UPI001056EB82|nr:MULTISPECIES: hypothetical protein [Bacteria]
MLPLPVLTTVTIARLDIGHHLNRPRAIPIGAAALTGRVQGSGVHFHLDSFVLQPSDPAEKLLVWLDQRLAEEQVTIAGYQLAGATALLDALPGAYWSSGLRSMAGLGAQPVMSLSARDLRGAPLTFEQACLHAGIRCSRIESSMRFSAWCRSVTEQIDHQTQVDAIAAWRLIMKRLSSLDQHGARVVDAMDEHLAGWLRASSNGAASLHACDIAAIGN